MCPILQGFSKIPIREQKAKCGSRNGFVGSDVGEVKYRGDQKSFRYSTDLYLKEAAVDL
jgi:hypothetical protein